MAIDVATVHTPMTRAMALGHRLDVINPGHACAALCGIDRGPLNLVEAREGPFLSPESTLEHLADVRSVSTIHTDILPPIPVVSCPTSSSLNLGRSLTLHILWTNIADHVSRCFRGHRSKAAWIARSGRGSR
ncbi:hypothetical protein KC351_g2 [Hortaea werneckii]|nr:hypothetical protein KC351_g2 [Hortaea werneckii]